MAAITVKAGKNGTNPRAVSEVSRFCPPRPRQSVARSLKQARAVPALANSELSTVGLFEMMMAIRKYQKHSIDSVFFFQLAIRKGANFFQASAPFVFRLPPH